MTASTPSPIYSAFHDSPIYRPLIKDFIRNLATRTSEIERAITEGDVEKIKFYAHRIKGAAASYGYPQLAEIADRIEAGAQGADHASAASLSISLRPALIEFQHFAKRISMVEVKD